MGHACTGPTLVQRQELVQRHAPLGKQEPVVPARMGKPLPTSAMPAPLGDRLRTILSMALFVVLAGYVGFSAVRLGLLLWQRVAAA